MDVPRSWQNQQWVTFIETITKKYERWGCFVWGSFFPLFCFCFLFFPGMLHLSDFCVVLKSKCAVLKENYKKKNSSSRYGRLVLWQRLMVYLALPGQSLMEEQETATAMWFTTAELFK